MDDRGQRWIQSKVAELLADPSITLTWGTEPGTRMILYLHQGGESEAKTLTFTRGLIIDCGAGRYFAHNSAIVHIRRSLKRLGFVTTSS